MLPPDDHNKLWDLRRAAEDAVANCDAPAFSAFPDVAPLPLEPPCAEPEERPEEQFFPPNDDPGDVLPARLLPDPLLVDNREVVVACLPGQTGFGDSLASVTMASGTLRQEVFLDDIFLPGETEPAFPLSELYRLAPRIGEIQQHVVDLLLWSGDEAAMQTALVDAFSLAPSLAAALVNALVAAQEIADANASGIGETQLDCVWPSDPMKLTCDDSNTDGYILVTGAGAASLTPEEEALQAAGRLAWRPAGAFVSRVSKADANANLEALLLALLVCLVTNQTTATATCEALTGQDFAALRSAGLDGVEFMTLDSVRVQPPVPRKLVLTSTIAANDQRTASRTVEEAQEKANLLALAELDCFFPSAALDISCVDINTDAADRMTQENFTLNQILNELATGDANVDRQATMPDNTGIVAGNTGPDASVGVRVTLPQGFFVGDTQESVDDLANTYALGFLTCKWRSIALVYSCDDKDSNPDALSEVQNHRAGGVYESTFALANKTPKQEVFPDAYNDPVNLYALPALSRKYTVRVVEGLFESTSGPEDASAQAALLATASLECTYCNPFIPEHCEPGAVNHVKEVPGIAYGNTLREGGLEPASGWDAYTADELYYCSQNTAEVLTNTMFIATIPSENLVDLGDECLYGNEAVYASCNPGVMSGLTGVAANLKYVKSTELGTDPYSQQSYPDASGTYVYIAANTITAESVEAATLTAMNLAKAQLNCFYMSHRRDAGCADAGAPGLATYNEQGALTNGGLPGLTVALASGSVASSSVASGTFLSYVSQAEANSLAEVLALSLLACNVGNDPYCVRCRGSTALPVGPAYTDATVYTKPDNGTPYSPESSPDASGLAYCMPKDGVIVSASSGAVAAKESANKSAQAIAKAALDCFWQSAAISLCCDAPAVIPSGSANTPETGTIAAGDCLNPKKYCADSIGEVSGEVALARKAVQSYVSQADANTRAYTMLWPQLDCFWQSARIEMQCGAPFACPPGSLNARETDTINHAGDAATRKYSTNSNGNVAGEVFLDRKAISSYLSQANANATAWLLTRAQLDCFFESAYVDLKCSATPRMPTVYNNSSPDNNEEIKTGTNTFGPPREPKGVSTVSTLSIGYEFGQATSPARAYLSYKSQKEANQQAYRSAYDQLDCFWRSANVRLRCTPPPFITDAETLYGETATIQYGSEGVYYESGAGAVVSYRNQGDANRQAYSTVRAILECGNIYQHVFQVSVFGGFACCTSKLDTKSLGAVSGLFYSPDEPSGDIGGGAVPGFSEVAVDNLDEESCGKEVAFFYIKASLHKRDGLDAKSVYATYYTTAVEIEVSRTERTLVEKSGDEYDTARRLLAVVQQENPDSTLNREAKDMCADVTVTQLVTKPQKLVSSQMGDNVVPTICDYDAPLGGGGGNACNNLAVIRDGDNVILTAGQVGDAGIDQQTIGTLAGSKGQYISAKVSLNGSDGTYSASIEKSSSVPTGDDDTVYRALAYITPAGGIQQMACGPLNVTVCRLWYQSSAPYYGITLS